MTSTAKILGPIGMKAIEGNGLDPRGQRRSEASIGLEEVQRLIRYDADSGRLYWKVGRRGSRGGHVGEEAGSVTETGHLRVGIYRKRILAHRIVWLLVTGGWPSKDIDHADGNPANNRFENLRLAEPWENAKNKKRYASNTTGFKGVSCWKDKWRAEITCDGVRSYLGLFESPEAAHRAYVMAAKALHGEFARAS